ncbi:MAG TPA: type 1 glutamine amidotransferase domain-containing protein [Steroidobacteraceae bacterium]|nr:type 1 glutamine amidotransferase domain-containing protein [Steroidobacteraceae bacterium]
MAQQSLEGVKIAILATDGFEQVELTEPRDALKKAGADTEVIAPKAGRIRGWKVKEWGDEVSVDATLEEADPKDYDALVLPGGVMNPDHLRMNPQAVAFVKAFFAADKPVAAICHGPWTVLEAGAARGHRMTSWPSLQTDLRNAGATWVDEEVVVDGKLVTSRKPDDLPAFNREIIELFSHARPEARASAARRHSQGAGTGGSARPGGV